MMGFLGFVFKSTTGLKLIFIPRNFDSCPRDFPYSYAKSEFFVAPKVKGQGSLSKESSLILAPHSAS